MSIGSNTKESTITTTIMPNIQPPPPHSPFSPQSHLSPRLLTPDTDGYTHPPNTAESLVFAKQPIPAIVKKNRAMLYSPLTESEASDTGHISEVPTYHSGKSQHISLLSAKLSDNAPLVSGSKRASGINHDKSTNNGMISGSSNPSTTFSSPVLKEPHGILQHGPLPQPTTPAAEKLPPSSILRRESLGTSTSEDLPSSSHIGLGFQMTMNQGETRGEHGLDGLVGRLEKVEERRERIGWADKVEKTTPASNHLARVPSAASSVGPRPRLQFAVAHPPSHGSTSASEAGDIPHRRVTSSTNSSRRPSSPFAKERKVQESLDEQNSLDEDEEEDDEDEDTPGEPAYLPGYNSRSTSSSGRRSEELHSPIDEEDEEDDLGYQEDEEDGMFSDEEETTAFDLSGDSLLKRKFAFARPTNYFNVHKKGGGGGDGSPATSPPARPAPNFFPPPNRRGRGHVRVADPKPLSLDVHKVSEEKKGCSRHCSPPPSSRSRSGSRVEAPPAVSSPSARFMKRPEPLSLAGPSKQRIVGSPMPPRVFESESDEDEDGDENDNEDQEENGEAMEDQEEVVQPIMRGGWKSDDSAFYPQGAASRTIRNVSAPPIHEIPVFEEDSTTVSLNNDAAEGGMRHWVRRASEQLPILRRPSNATMPDNSSYKGRSRETSFTSPIPCTVAPSIDYTPVVGSNISTQSEGTSGLKDRLEKTISGQIGQPPLPPTAVISRDPAISSIASGSQQLSTNTSMSNNGPRPPAAGTTIGAESRGPGLGRTTSLSNKVTFQPADKPIRNIAPHRSVSHTIHQVGNKGSSRESSPADFGAPAPIRCPKRMQREDLGWSDEALMSIRKQVGKGLE